MRLAFKLTVLAGALVGALVVAGVSFGLGRAAPSNTSLPSVSGAARDGSILAASTGTWANKPVDFSYQWLSCDVDAGSCTSIVGANSRQYTLQMADVGHRVRVAVRATNADGAGNATSRATDVVQAIREQNSQVATGSIGQEPMRDGQALSNGWQNVVARGAQALGDRARARVESHYSLDLMCARYAALYESIAASGQVPPA